MGIILDGIRLGAVVFVGVITFWGIATMSGVILMKFLDR